MTTLREQLWDQLGTIPGMLEGESVFSTGPAYWVNGKQVAHFVDEQRMELRLTKPVIRELRASLKADSRVELRTSASDWLIVQLGSEADLVFITALAQRAAIAHFPHDGAAPKLPPTGAALERRRRFH
ncbi:MAG: luciferase family protein [Dehalococcoidia bacterium]